MLSRTKHGLVIVGSKDIGPHKWSNTWRRILYWAIGILVLDMSLGWVVKYLDLRGKIESCWNSRAMWTIRDHITKSRLRLSCWPQKDVIQITWINHSGHHDGLKVVLNMKKWNLHGGRATGRKISSSTERSQDLGRNSAGSCQNTTTLSLATLRWTNLWMAPDIENRLDDIYELQ